jgi:ATP-dependent helicase HrpA
VGYASGQERKRGDIFLSMRIFSVCCLLINWKLLEFFERSSPLSLAKKIKNIHARLPRAMLRDEQNISKRLQTIARNAEAGKGEKDLIEQLGFLEQRLETSIRRRERRFLQRPKVSYPKHLPIIEKTEAIIDAVHKNPVVIISGDTGSGKSTQIPKMCLEADQGIRGKIGCTQPRRIAATAIARRIAEELGEKIGESVGYRIRFKDRTHPNAYIKILTDGMLLAETQQDPFLWDYDTLIIDEAHERSLNIDFLLGILKTLLPKRKDLKLIITSATMDTKKFSAAFDSAPVIEVRGRVYPVEVEYLPVDRRLEIAGDITHVEMAVQAVEILRRNGRSGDILIFMPTEQDIRETCDRLEATAFSGAMVLPLFARLTGREQHRVFSPYAGQKIVVATNVAETSLTIPGIKYVVDTGLARIPRYLPRTRTTILPISPISRSSADQRKGRCGRVENGVCFRLYTEDDYASRPEFTPPEILRSNLAEVILRMLSLRLGHIASFPFVDKPNPKSVKDGFDLLLELGAVSRSGKQFVLTERGRLMARMPLDPRVSRMMLEAQKEGCLAEMAVIASALSIQDPRERPLEKAEQADRAHARFRDKDSDFMTLLNIWKRYQQSWKDLKTQNQVRGFCKNHFLSFTRMREWDDIYEQITAILKEQGTEVDELSPGPTPGFLDSHYAGIHRAILSGYLSNISTKKEKNNYLAAGKKEVMIFPGSSLFNKGSPWIAAAEMVKTTRVFARTVARIEPQWLEALGGELCKSSYSEPHWDKIRGEVRAHEQVTLFGLVIVSKRPVSYGPMNPDESHEIFIHSALVEGGVKESFPFLVHNLGLMEKIARLEDKVRRRDILVSNPAISDFYSKRLPGVYDIPTLKQRIREMGGDRFLMMREQDLIVSRPDETVLARYPDHMTFGERSYQLSYKFAPGSEQDGVTIRIPSSLISRFPANRLEWLVPGLVKEKIASLIKGLPKRYRRQLVPVSRTVQVVVSEMETPDEPIAAGLSRFIYRRFGVDIPPGEWPVAHIPDHLRMRVSITDHRGRELESGRGVNVLRRHLERPPFGNKELVEWKEAKKKWERTGIKAWDFDSLPQELSLRQNLVAYPGLEPAEGAVNIRLFETANQAVESHKKGVKVLFSLHLAKELKFVKRILVLPEEMAVASKYFGGPRAVQKALYESLVHRLFHLDIRSRATFLARGAAVRPILVAEARDLLDQAGRVLLAYARTRVAVEAVERANPSNRVALSLCSDLRKDLDRLVPGDFVQHYPPGRLTHLPRYLKALEIRVERGANDVKKDRRKAADLEKFVNTLEDMKIQLSTYASREKKEALDALRWMVEEFRVSLFAQELKTSFPVSKKRLERKIKEIERMV